MNVSLLAGAMDRTAAPVLACPPGRAAILCDFDGTLAELARTPAQARPHPEAAAVLSRLIATTGGAVAIITGRPIATIDALLDLPSLSVAGLHGLERRDSTGRRWRARAPLQALAVARGLLERLVEAHPPLLLEDKDLSLALHYRTAPDLAGLADRITQQIVSRTGGELRRLPGSMVFELVPQGASKGAAVGAVLTDTPFRERVPVYLGDDHGDEEAFRVVNALGGLSVRIGPMVKDSAARAGLESVDAAVAWLRSLAREP
jgi:trehalose 6-phosphate phosphatase